MDSIEISKISIAEVESLKTISIQTFTETFSEYNTKNDMQKYISTNLSSEKLLKELNSNESAFYVLNLNTEIIGYLKVNTGMSQTEIQNNTSLEIERIYVKQAFHGKNFGQRLLQKAIDIAKKKGCHYIWLAVWEKNLKAISFYTKHGFIAFDKHIFQLGDDAQLDIMMKLELK